MFYGVTILLEKLFYRGKKSIALYSSEHTLSGVCGWGVQQPEYRIRLRQELAFFSRSQSRTRSGYF